MTPLIVEVLDQERALEGLFRVYQDFAWNDPVRGVITIPAGYVTDFASIPFFARWIIPTAGKCAKPALLHDWVMARGPNPRWATGIFNRALKADGNGSIRRCLMVAAVAISTFPRLYLFKPQPG